MKLSELGGKEIVNLNNGCHLGIIANSDIVINEETGQIVSLLLPDKSQFGFFNNKYLVEIPWNSIKKIGNDMIIVELNEN